MECESCGVFFEPGQGPDAMLQDGCPNCGRPYRSQPNSLHSEMELRNMPAPGESDMGGNPLQEGIYADTDGGWQNRMKRDESFASVKSSEFELDGACEECGAPGVDSRFKGPDDRSICDDCRDRLGTYDDINEWSENPEDVKRNFHNELQALPEVQHPTWGVHGKVAEFEFDDGPIGGGPMTINTKTPVSKFIVSPDGQVHSAPEPTTHEYIAATLGNPEQYLQSGTLGQLYDDNSTQFYNHSSGLDPDTIGNALQAHYGAPVQIPADLTPSSNEERWFGQDWGQGSHGDILHPEHEMADPNFLQKKDQEQEAVGERGRPFPYYDNPFFNRGGSLNMEPYTPWAHLAEEMYFPAEGGDVVPPGPHTVEAAPHPQAGMHNEVVANLGDLGVSVNGRPLDPQYGQELLRTKSPLGGDKWDPSPVMISHPDPDIANLAKSIVETGSSAPMQQWHHDKHNAYQAEVPNPILDKNAITGLYKLDAYLNGDRIAERHYKYFPQKGMEHLQEYKGGPLTVGAESPEKLQVLQHALTTGDIEPVKELLSRQAKVAGAALAPIAEGLAGGGLSMGEGVGAGMLGGVPGIGGLMRGAMSPGMGGTSVLQSLGIGGQMGQGQNAPQPYTSPPPARDFSQIAAIETPTSHPEIPNVETNDPEAIDPHEFNDGDNTPNLYDPRTNDIGGTGDPTPEFNPEGQAMQRFQMLLPLILHYNQVEESGAHDPLIRGLHEHLESEIPGYMNYRQSSPFQLPHPSIPGDLGQPISPQQYDQQIQTGQPVPPPAGTKRPCPYCGSAIEHPTDMTCPSCSANIGNFPSIHQAGDQPTCQQCGRPISTAEKFADPLCWRCRNEMNAETKESAANQGPHSSEQFAAVSELLLATGRQDEIPIMLQQPWQYADELAQVQNKVDKAPTDDTQQSTNQMPEPAQEEAPPGDTMPVPNPAQQMYAAILKHGADSIAPTCPKCDSHTTGYEEESGESHCHACGHRWTPAGINPTETTERSSAHPSEHQHSDLHVPNGVPAADQVHQHDVRHERDTGHAWQDENGEPLQVGQEYEMYSTQYDIPDMIRIEQVKPESIEYTITGEYGLEHRTEVTHEEADMFGTTFHPVSGDVDFSPEQDTNPEFEGDPNSDNTHYNGPGMRDMASPHMNLGSYTNNFSFTSNHPGIITSAGDSGNTSVTTSADRAWLMEGVTAGAKFSPQEQRAFIDEKGEARNRDKLDLSNTHYETDEIDDDFLWAM